ncbi:MAG: RNA-binding S4 domain-containing protein [Pseudomonadota bacterium]|jgi:ribosome-associated heat shock protein Hsp15
MTGPGATDTPFGNFAQRIDKWLWYSRFFKSRSAAARFIQSGKIRVNRCAVSKTSHLLKTGDILTFVLNDSVRVVQVINLGVRRGPPPVARMLYQDLDRNTVMGGQGGQNLSCLERRAPAAASNPAAR